MMNAKNCATIFDELENVHLIKDPGMIPFTLEHSYGFNCTVVGSNDEEYKYAEDFYDIKLVKIPDNNCSLLLRRTKRCIWLFKNASNINLLILFFYSNITLLYIALYKRLNPKGKIYIHCDSYPQKILKSKKPIGLKGFIKRQLIKQQYLDDITWGVQSKNNIQDMKERWPFKNTLFVPDGYWWPVNSRVNYTQKENIILFTGRIGTAQKRTDVLLEGFAMVADALPSWRLRLVGPIENSFRDYLEKFLASHKLLKSRVELPGEIYDRGMLKAEYERAKIFSLTSDWENFPISQIEAMSNGCSLLCADFESAKDIIQDGKYGELFETGNISMFAQKLVMLAQDDQRMHKICDDIQLYVDNNYTWKNVLHTVVNKLDIENE